MTCMAWDTESLPHAIMYPSSLPSYRPNSLISLQDKYIARTKKAPKPRLIIIRLSEQWAANSTL